jgi:hypothetical protein
MRFYGRGIVWDAANDRKLMKFENGVFDTDDERITKLLIDGGYRHEENETPSKAETPVDEPATEKVDENVAEKATPRVTADIGVAELREIGRQRGLSFKPGTTKIDMAKAINAK